MPKGQIVDGHVSPLVIHRETNEENPETGIAENRIQGSTNLPVFQFKSNKFD